VNECSCLSSDLGATQENALQQGNIWVLLALLVTLRLCTHAQRTVVMAFVNVKKIAHLLYISFYLLPSPMVSVQFSKWSLPTATPAIVHHTAWT